ncbi:MAG: hypothetical protein ABIK28_25130 [Planctomycetota bacterium]
MRKPDIFFIIFFTVIAATLCGALASVLFAGPTTISGIPGLGSLIEADVIETGTINVSDDKGFTRIRISARSEGSPTIQLLDQKGNCKAKLGLANDQPYLTFYDEEGNARFRTYLDEQQFPVMRFYDESKTIDWSVPLLPQNRKEGRKWPD